jgi:hypothetical protein
LYQDLGKVSGIPYRSEFKVTGNVPLKWGVQLSASLYADPVYSANFGTNLAYNNNTLIYSPGAYYAGQLNGLYMVNWSITPTTRYPSDCAACPKEPSASDPTRGAVVDPGLKQGSELIPLVAPGSRLTPRLNQLDIGARKVFHPRENMTLTGEATIFNVINSNTVIGESETLGTKAAPYLAGGIGGQPVQIANPRMLRLSLQFKFLNCRRTQQGFAHPCGREPTAKENGQKDRPKTLKKRLTPAHS